MNIEKLLMMLKKNNVDKIVITLAVFVSLLPFGIWCYRSFRSSHENKEIIEVRRDLSLFLQQLDDYEQKVIEEKKVRQDDFEKNIEILKDQGIWDGLLIESGSTKVEVDFEEYYNSTIKDSQEKFKIQLGKLLEKLEKEKNLESFRKELEKLGKERKKDVDAFAEFAQRVQTEAKKPIPFFATWVGLEISIATCLIVTFIILFLSSQKYPSLLLYLFPIIYFPSQFLIFPLINCLLSLKMSTLRETYKHYFANKFKTFSLFITPFVWELVVVFIVTVVDSTTTKKSNKKKPEEIKPKEIKKDEEKKSEEGGES